MILSWAIKKPLKNRNIILIVIVYGVISLVIIKTLEYFAGTFNSNTTPSFIGGIINYSILNRRSKVINNKNQSSPELTNEADVINEKQLNTDNHVSRIIANGKRRTPVVVDYLKLYNKVKILLCLSLTICAIVITTIAAISKIHEMRYVNVINNDKEYTSVRIIDTWNNKYTWYVSYYDTQQQRWINYLDERYY